jgi:hypothetical protein
MSSIKLKHSGGNSVIIAAPSSNPASDRTITVPSNADGTILTTTNPKAGNIIQVLQTAKTDVFSTTSNGFHDIGLSVSITPSSVSNKILIHYDANVSGDDLTMVKLLRDSTDIGIGDAGDSNMQRVTQGGQYQSGNNDKVAVYSGSFLDSPSSTSSLTYKLQVYKYGGATMRVNTPVNNSNAIYTGRGISTITAMEVAV